MDDLSFTPDPSAEVNSGFDIVKPGNYRMRIQGSEKMAAIQTFVSKSGNKCAKVRLVYVDPGSCVKLDETPAKNPGSIIDSSLVMEPRDKQGKLRGLVEACGKDWNSISSLRDLEGCEVTVQVGTRTYEGNISNEAKRYIKE